MTLEELRKQKAEIDKQIRELKDCKSFGRVRLKKNEYKCRSKLLQGEPTYDVAIHYRDCLRTNNDKWRNVISAESKKDIYEYLVDLIRDLITLSHELELEFDKEALDGTDN